MRYFLWFPNTVLVWPKKTFLFFFLYLSLKLLMEMSRTSPGFPRKIKVHPWLFKLKELELMTPVRLSLALNSCTHWLVGSLLLLELEIGFFPRSRLRVVRWLPSKKWTFYWSLGRPLHYYTNTDYYSRESPIFQFSLLLYYLLATVLLDGARESLLLFFRCVV